MLQEVAVMKYPTIGDSQKRIESLENNSQLLLFQKCDSNKGEDRDKISTHIQFSGDSFANLKKELEKANKLEG